MKRMYVASTMVLDVDFVDKKSEWKRMEKIIVANRQRREIEIIRMQKNAEEKQKQEDSYFKRLSDGNNREQLFYEIHYYPGFPK